MQLQDVEQLCSSAQRKRWREKMDRGGRCRLVGLVPSIASPHSPVSVTEPRTLNRYELISVSALTPKPLSLSAATSILTVRRPLQERLQGRKEKGPTAQGFWGPRVVRQAFQLDFLTRSHFSITSIKAVR